MSEGESFVYTACPGWGDHDYCAIKTIVKDGKIERTERVIYSEPEELDGHICQKGCLAGRQPYDPNRLLHPLKRVGERGEGKWEEISWDQALDEICGKLMEIKEKYGPEAVAMWHLAAGVPPSSGFEMLMPSRFANLFGCTSPMASIGLDNGPFYSEFYLTNNIFFHTFFDPRNWDDTDLVYVWGCNPIENQMRAAQNLVRARDNGAKIVDIGLIFDGTAGFADEFYGVKPSSDGDLAMYMVNYIFENDRQDDEFLLKRTTGAYLVDEEAGLLARAGEDFCVYDNAADGFGVVPAKGGAYPSDDIALFGRWEKDGKSYATVLTLLKEKAASWTLEYTAERTGLAPDVVEGIAAEWTDPAIDAFIITGYGMRYMNSNETYRLIHVLGILTGRLGKPRNGVVEGLALQGYPLALNSSAVTMPDGPEGVKSCGIRMADFFEIAQTDESPYKALIVCEGNPVHQQPDRQRWLDVISRMELVVDTDIWMTDTGELADYVLPDCMSFEREDLIESACYNHIVLQEPAIEPMGECKDPVWLWSEIGKRCGLGEYFTMSTAEYIDVRLDTDYPMVTCLEPKVTYERLKKEKMIRFGAPTEPKWDPWLNADEVFPNESGRIELFADRLADHGRQLAGPEEPLKIGKSEEYPYQLFTGRQRWFMQSSFTDDPINIAMSGGEPATRLNPIDARAFGFQDGDKVEVYNDRGHVVTKLVIDESVPAGTVHVWFGWRRRQFEEGTYAEMVQQCANKDTTRPLEDKWFADWIAQGHSDNTNVEFLTVEIGSTDCYWDSWCNVRKYEAGKEA